jgi:hypothetical protein
MAAIVRRAPRIVSGSRLPPKHQRRTQRCLSAIVGAQRNGFALAFTSALKTALD